MNEFRFQAALRSRFDRASITVRKDPIWAHANGWHQDALLCWDRNRITDEPYVFFICQKDGIPHEPCTGMIDLLWTNSMNHLAGARGTYLQDVMLRERDRMNADNQACSDRFDRKYNEILDVPGRAQSLAGNSQMWTVA